MSGNRIAWLSEILEKHYKLLMKWKNTSLSSVSLYQRIAGEERLVVIRSHNGNDLVYERLRSLEHPHLPQIYDLYSSEEELVVLEEYVQGITLKEQLDKGPLPAAAARRYMRMLCEAAEALHSQGIVHRDIKPANIIVNGETLKLIDFSIARILQPDLPQDTMALGTVGYAAPEQFGLMQTSPLSDIYALGVTYNEMLTGQHPSVGIAKGHDGRIIQKCLQVQAAKRYSTVSRLKRAL